MNQSTELPDDVQNFLRKKQFTVENITPQKKFIFIKGTSPAHPQQLLLKISTGSAHLSLTQRNLVAWTASIQQNIPKDVPFGIAPILDSGVISESKHWVLMPFVEGTPFATIQDSLSRTTLDDPAKYLDNIVDLIKYVEKTSARGLEGIDWRQGRGSRKDKLALLENLISWARPQTPYLSELLQLVNANCPNLRTTPAHGDFTETNLVIDGNDRPVLIDAELGSGQQYKFYDVTEFYNRLYTRLCRPDLARQLLRVYVKDMRPAQKKRFLNNFLCLSALRCVGNFYEIEETISGPEKATRTSYAHQFAEDIVTYRVVQLD